MSSCLRALPAAELEKIERLQEYEWLVTNGLGGYSSGTVSGTTTRRYHGLLIAAFPAPLGRYMVLNGLREFCIAEPGGNSVSLQPDGSAASARVEKFCLEEGLPLWHLSVPGFLIEKRIFMPYRQNIVCVTYRLLEGGSTFHLQLRPTLHFRPHDADLASHLDRAYQIDTKGPTVVITNAEPNIELAISCLAEKWRFQPDELTQSAIFHCLEYDRGYPCYGELWSPGFFMLSMTSGQEVSLLASTEGLPGDFNPGLGLDREVARRKSQIAAADPRTREGTAAELVLAADQFIISPPGRQQRAEAGSIAGEAHTIVAGYHWFSDWGRDTMISLEGLCLLTGRYEEARSILLTFSSYVKHGLIPNLFPEGSNAGVYHTADASLWFFHAVDRYLHYTGDQQTLLLLLPALKQIMDAHLEGTDFGIKLDRSDGLLLQGAPGYQLTWMDAKVGDWVVTPRRGKAVEINALWYNALRLMSQWSQSEEQGYSGYLAQLCEQASISFNKRFWYPPGGYLYDVVDGEAGDDPSCRPNQLLAISLPHPVLGKQRWHSVLEVLNQQLLTPHGLRSLAPGHPDYHARYYGDIVARDAAYHQGTVWAWLIGPFVDAWQRTSAFTPQRAKEVLQGLENELSRQCLGTIAEIFDAEAPFTPRGCVSQAWSVAETLRALVKLQDYPEIPIGSHLDQTAATVDKKS